MIGTAFGLMLQPRRQWKKIGQLSDRELPKYLLYPVILGLIPAIAWYYGTTAVGWEVADSGNIRLTERSAAMIAVLFYFTQIAAIWCIGYLIHWMSETYGAESSVVKGMVLAGFTATPLMIAGAVGFYPIFWIDLLIGIAAVSYTVYLLYSGIPPVMKVPEERGFLFSSAVVAVALVMLIAVMGATVILWDAGFAPQFLES